MNSSIPKAKQKQYADYVKQITPTHSLPMNMAKAFLTGGVICVVGQIITNFAKFVIICPTTQITPPVRKAFAMFMGRLWVGVICFT